MPEGSTPSPHFQLPLNPKGWRGEQNSHPTQHLRPEWGPDRSVYPSPSMYETGPKARVIDVDGMNERMSGGRSDSTRL